MVMSILRNFRNNNNQIILLLYIIMLIIFVNLLKFIENIKYFFEEYMYGNIEI